MGQRDDSYQEEQFVKLDEETIEWMSKFEVEFKQILKDSLAESEKFHRPPHISDEVHELLIRFSALEYWTRWKMAVSATVWERLAKKLNEMADRISEILDLTDELKKFLKIQEEKDD
ncbi:MAG: hypothetical protein ACYSW3_00455 [Planctomycetota bacterium]|jgi:hypothetical protein